MSESADEFSDTSSQYHESEEERDGYTTTTMNTLVTIFIKRLRDHIYRIDYWINVSKWIPVPIDEANHKQLAIQLVEEFIVSGGRFTDKDADGKSPLHAVVSVGNLWAIRLLLLLGADARGTCQYGFTPLHCFGIETAVGYNAIVDVLLEFGADLEDKDIYGRTALDHYMSRVERSSRWDSRIWAISALLARGANLNKPDGTCKESPSERVQTMLHTERYLREIVAADANHKAKLDSFAMGRLLPRSVSPIARFEQGIIEKILKHVHANYISEKKKTNLQRNAASSVELV
jgi:Ankyrin repeats (3 copies)